ncbi:MAG TPA: hypothetical protein VD973_11475, partial [Symbiobacteriaceae bacterium]|nr:hypothetical protein [Symbiobacteriaceae bacterium]
LIGNARSFLPFFVLPDALQITKKQHEKNDPGRNGVSVLSRVVLSRAKHSAGVFLCFTTDDTDDTDVAG